MIVIFNCPPGSGKDTIANILARRYSKFEVVSFKDKLMEIARCIVPEWDMLYKNKNVPSTSLGGLSPRQFIIRMAEEWIKPILGVDYFARSLASSCQGNKIYLVPDGGFQEEVDYLKKLNMEVLVIQWGRPGCTFENDSRYYLDNAVKIRDNNGSLEAQVSTVLDTIRRLTDDRIM